MAYIKHILDLIAKNQIKIFFKKNLQKAQKASFALNKKFQKSALQARFCEGGSL